MTGTLTPVVLVSGVDADAMAATTIGLQWELPSAVAVVHTVDLDRGILLRVVSDRTGLLEREEIELAHCCPSCAIREDVIPTLNRLAELDRWCAVVAHLPVTAEAAQVCRGLHLEDHPAVRIGAVVTALAGEDVGACTTGPELLSERGLGIGPDDTRGLAETAAGLVEYADVVTLHGEAPDTHLDLLRAIARPDALVVPDGHPAPGPGSLLHSHTHAGTEAWATETRRDALPRSTRDGVWQLDLRADRPFDPQRLHDRFEEIGAGPHRARGCFWLPTRPQTVGGWDGAGGQVSIGAVGAWGTAPPLTRLVVTGLEDEVAPAARADLRRAFEECLVAPGEDRARSRRWQVPRDGFEPWLGPIHEVA